MSKIQNNPNRTLVFSPLKTFVGFFHSASAAAKSYNIRVQSVHYACTGQCISCQGNYFRYLSDDVEIDYKADLGVLRLEEYDELCGVKRKIYPTKRMERTGMKYSKNKK